MGNNCGEWSTKFPPLCHCRSPSAPSAVVVRRVDSAFAARARDGNMQLAVWLEQPGTKGGPPTSQAFEDEPTNGIKAASKTIDSPGSINIIIACRTRDASPESPSRFPLRQRLSMNYQQIGLSLSSQCSMDVVSQLNVLEFLMSWTHLKLCSMNHKWLATREESV